MTEIAARGRPFPPGVSGNPNGRPPGHHTRHQFSNAFMDDLTATWAEYGLAAMQRTARESPQSFFACCARLLPQNVAVTVQQNYANALDEIDLAILKAIRSGIPSANAQTPEAVLQFTLDAIRAHGAQQLIDAPSDDITEGSKE